MSELQRLVIRPEQLNPPDIQLSPEQQRYLGRVLRLKVGDRFIAIAQQQWWLSELTKIGSDLQARLLQPMVAQTELPIPVVLVAALPKGSGFDEVVRQATELGVAEIVPVLSDRTLLQPSPQKLERWRRIAQEATEQAERQWVPTIRDPMPFVAHLQALADQPQGGSYFLAATRQDAPLLQACVRNCSSTSRCILIAIGPEGGWTDSELEQAIQVGYQPVSLGQRILRAVTAPLAALAIIGAELESEKPQELRD